MRIINLNQERSPVYTSNSFLILGDFSAIGDVNTLIDTGSNPGIMDLIATAPTGLGKHSIEQVILTHTHSDHIALLPTLREKYHPKVYAQSAFIGADIVVRDGQTLKCGDRYFEVIRCPGHSDDSICLFCPTDGVLFVGDASVVIRTTDNTHEHGFVAALERLCRLNVRTIYFGHGSPLITGASQALRESLRNVNFARRNVI